MYSILFILTKPTGVYTDNIEEILSTYKVVSMHAHARSTHCMRVFVHRLSFSPMYECTRVEVYMKYNKHSN